MSRGSDREAHFLLLEKAPQLVEAALAVIVTRAPKLDLTHAETEEGGASEAHERIQAEEPTRCKKPTRCWKPTVGGTNHSVDPAQN